jgi:invasion protein IalB
MKKSVLAISIIFFVASVIISSCTKQQAEDPCSGKGVLNVENKLDSTISVKVVETHETMSIERDYTLPFTLAGNQPYTLTIDGPQYHKDTTFMLLFCDNKLFIVTK